jgi:hypothetical protein
VWGYRPGLESRTVYTTVRRLRLKIEVDPKRPVHLVTEPGGAYRFVPARHPPAEPRDPTRSKPFAAKPSAARVEGPSTLDEPQTPRRAGQVATVRLRWSAGRIREDAPTRVSGELRLGRDAAANDCVLVDPFVSRRHAVLSVDQTRGVATLRNLSRRGSHVGGAEVGERTWGPTSGIPGARVSRGSGSDPGQSGTWPP